MVEKTKKDSLSEDNESLFWLRGADLNPRPLGHRHAEADQKVPCAARKADFSRKPIRKEIALKSVRQHSDHRCIDRQSRQLNWFPQIASKTNARRKMTQFGVRSQLSDTGFSAGLFGRFDNLALVNQFVNMLQVRA